MDRDVPGFYHQSGEGGRVISYAAAVREALDQALTYDKRVFVMGEGVDDGAGIFGATLGLHEKHGRDRVFDTPLSEAAVTGIAVGASLAGMRPVFCHNRPDFLLIAMDQIVNHASKWRYMFGGHVQVPLVIWAVIGRGWGLGAQHSQALQGLFMHVPGLKLVMPSTPYDAKGLMLACIADGNPCIIIDHRGLFKHTGPVPEEPYAIPLGKAAIRRQGKDATIVGTSYIIIEALRAAEELQQRSGIDVEVIDLRTLKPLDEEMILESVKKTGRLLIVDTGWKTGGVTAEIAALVAEKGFDYLRKPIKRVACVDVPTPSGYTLEAAFYPGVPDIVAAIQELLR